MAAKSIPDITMKRNPNNSKRPALENGPPTKRRKLSLLAEVDNDNMYVSSTECCCNEAVKEEEPLWMIIEEDEGPSLEMEPASPPDQMNENTQPQSPPIIKPNHHVRAKDFNRLRRNYYNANIDKKPLVSAFQPYSPPIIKPQRHLRGKDLNRLIQQYHSANSSEHPLPSDQINENAQPLSPSGIKPNQHSRGKDLNQAYHCSNASRKPIPKSDQSCPPSQRMESCMGREFYPIPEEGHKNGYSSSGSSF
eukprot:CAMPEP_0194206530 /NCGR_PEP_ID=MMETSP0156-20130528/5527_1 /TAXON_ID=33649 /ORGANISM="Thalassionema nitzschioides, Strain L26-B" /LENGTH=249 /DNA_ID=CAMNT_0038933069 /DNA_START=395 /DNA_END=1144 /DNA_ORIENTATION=+